MLKILQVSLQQYVNRELPDVQDEFRKGRGTRDQIADICWIIKKAREWLPTPVFLPGESHGQRSLADCIPWSHKELDTAEPHYLY